jgi:UDP-N-acetylmuramoylalanine--D-glutamate ligase
MNNVIAIIGAGESGIGAALLARKNGEKVFVSDGGSIKEEFKKELDINKIPFEEKGHSFEKLANARLIIKSPGVGDHLELIKRLKEQGSILISEIEYGYRYCKSEIIAITGSNGKTTTTGIIYHLLKNAGKNVAVGGNYGKSFCRLLCEEEKEIYVLELSSFQLDGIIDFKANTGILLNISADHLDRYNYDFELYAKSKFRIMENQTKEDLMIYNSSDHTIRKYIEAGNCHSKKIAIGEIESDGKELSINSKMIFDLSKCSLKGRHNWLNISSAIHAVFKYGLSTSQIQNGLNSFKNEPHRLEIIANINGVEYINDSKATNVEAVWYALDAIEKPIVWIAGGTDKGNNYESLFDLVSKKVKTLVCLGADNEKISNAFTPFIKNIEKTSNMEDAIQIANRRATSGDAILLSPACASFDLFNNYIHRGDSFRNSVWKYLRNNKRKQN